MAKGRQLHKQVYLISKQIPNEERFGIISQLRHASISVSCNIAEGSGRMNGKEQKRFSKIAYSSLMEVLNLLIICVDLQYVAQSEVNQIRSLVEEISRKINALQLSQLEKHKQQKHKP